MLQSIVESYIRNGFRKFYLSVGYKAEVIIDYFGDGAKFGCKIKYLAEQEPLGTAGAMNLLPDLDVPFIVHNGDILSDYSPMEMLDSHAASRADMTMAVWRYEHQIPYGVCEIDETHRLTALNEKPVNQWAINAGIYVVEPRALEKMPSGYVDMTDFSRLLDHVHIFPIEGQWHDVGTLDALGRASKEWRS